MKGLTEEEEEEVKKDYDIHTLMKHSTGVLAQIHYKPIPSNVLACVPVSVNAFSFERVGFTHT